MEESIETLIRTAFSLPETDIRTYSPLTLAYIGDGIYELVIRTILVERGNAQVNQLHQRASHLVRASAQKDMLHIIEARLSEEELAVYKRGRNAKSATTAKHASVSDYRTATGFEALLGYLYLTARTERMLELIQLGLAGLKQQEQERKEGK